MTAEDVSWDILTSLRDAIGDYYDDRSFPLPDRRAVTPGLPAWDCEQLTVTLMSTYNHNGNMVPTVLIEQTRQAVGFTVKAYVVDVAVVRCVATVDDGGAAPSVERIEADAKMVVTDEVILRDAVIDAIAAGILPGCNRVAFETWQVLPPSGGFVSGVLRIRISS